MIKIIKISNTIKITTVEIINQISTVILVTMSMVAFTLYDYDKSTNGGNKNANSAGNSIN